MLVRQRQGCSRAERRQGVQDTAGCPLWLQLGAGEGAWQVGREDARSEAGKAVRDQSLGALQPQNQGVGLEGSCGG